MTAKATLPAASIENWPDMTKWTSGWTPMLEANRLALDNWVLVSEALMRSALAFSQQMTEFAQARFREDIGVYERLAKCQSPSEAAECQREFAKTATAQYMDHANRLSILMTDLTNTAPASRQDSLIEGRSAVHEKTK